MKLKIPAIKKLMAQQRLTHAKLGELAGLTRCGVNLILSRGTCSIPNAGKLADALGVEIEEIIDET